MSKEKTSKKTASKAGFVLEEADTVLAELKRSQMAISKAIVLVEAAKSAAASSLTQREK
jgi:hypothetical protein